MARYRGSESVKGGLYWSPSQWQIVPLTKAGGVLPGGPETRYIRLPLVMMLLLGPIMGAGLVAFLPFIGFALILVFGSKRMYAALQKMAATPPVRRGAEVEVKE